MCLPNTQMALQTVCCRKAGEVRPKCSVGHSISEILQVDKFPVEDVHPGNETAKHRFAVSRRANVVHVAFLTTPFDVILSADFKAWILSPSRFLMSICCLCTSTALISFAFITSETYLLISPQELCSTFVPVIFTVFYRALKTNTCERRVSVILDCRNE